MALIGIDLGTTNSLVAIWRNSKVEILKNSLGHLMTPSVVSVEEDGSIVVGEIAKQRRVSHPSRTVAEFKRRMGSKDKISVGESKYLPEELSAFLLKKLIEDSEQQLGEKVTEAVISVPAYFDNNQREATEKAARMAGLKVKRLINEPSAAIAYHQWKEGNVGTEGIYLVVDFGGGTLDVSVVDCFENIIEIIAVSGDNQLGGKDFDRAIAVDFCEKIGFYYENLSPGTWENILWAAENVKRKLTTEERVTMRVTIRNKEYAVEYTNKDLLKICAEVLLQIKTVINEAVKGAKIELEDIVDVVLVGGSCKMPVVQKFLSALLDRELTAKDDCEHYVALGVGVITGIIAREEEIADLVMTDVCPFSLGISTRHGKEDKTDYMSVIIPKNSILPIAKSGRYYGLEPFQKHIRFEIYQGEELYAEKNLRLGEIDIKVTPNEAGDTVAEITFCYDINGILQVTARDLLGKNTAEAVILKKDSQLTNEEIDRKRIIIEKEMRFERNKEDNKNLLAWGQRLYAQAGEEHKEYIVSLIHDFEVSLQDNDAIMVRRKMKYIAQCFLQLEMAINKDYFDNEDIVKELLEDEDL